MTTVPASAVLPRIMARSIRIEIPGGFYHVMARGNRREKIYADDDDRRFFLQTLSEACGMTGWRVHAWVLMGNHYHLLIETPEPNLVEGMKWLQNTVTRRFNVRHGKWGRLFGDRYKAVIVQAEESGYYRALLDYIHLNPVRARIIQPRRGQSVMDFPWSSVAGGYALPGRKRAKWLAADAGLKAFGLADTTLGRRQFVERLDRRAVEEEVDRCGLPVVAQEVDGRLSNLQRGWYWGTQAFAEGLLKIVRTASGRLKSRTYRSAPERRSHDEMQAENWVQEGLLAAGLSATDVTRLPGSDPQKVALARLVWENTTVPQAWIAERLEMGSAANVSQQLSRGKHASRPRNLPAPLRQFLQSVKK